MAPTTKTPYTASRIPHATDNMTATKADGIALHPAGTTKAVRGLGPRASVEGPSFAPLEPIRWTTTADKRGDNNRVRNRDGKIERLPSIAHTASSDYMTRTVDERTRGRFRSMLTADGNVMSIVHTNGAAHLTKIEPGGRFSRDGYCQHILDKGFALGWIDVNAGCLVRQIKAGTVNPDRCIAPELAKATMCPTDAKTCKHTAFEQAARQKKQRAKMEAIELAAAGTDPAVAIARGVVAALRQDREAQGAK